MSFDTAYDAVLAKWPVAPEPVDVPSAFGTTHVNVCGSGEPLVLLHSGGATSTVWFNNVGALAGRYRVHAVDQINDAGRSVNDGRPIHSRDDLTAWLDALLDGLNLSAVHLAGHSYGGWIALSYALHAPQRVSRLTLLDPTLCFAPMAFTYRLHAVPLFLPGPRADRMRRFLRWETDGAPLDPDWFELTGLAAGVPRKKIVMPRRPAPDRLRELHVPTLVLVAERTKSHDPAAVAGGARVMPDVTTAVLRGATHHTIPMLDADELNGYLR